VPGSVCKRTFYPPKHLQGNNYWDVCYFNFESQIEIGAMVKDEPQNLRLKGI
jgi:hypothetical protein